MNDVVNLSVLMSEMMVEAGGLQLGDYEVCRLLDDYVCSAIKGVQAWRYGEDTYVEVSRVEITPEYVRAYPDDVDPWLASFVQKDLPEGLYEACLLASEGPPKPFPPREVAKSLLDLLAQVDGLAFPKGKAAAWGEEPKHLVMSALTYSDFRKAAYGRFELSVTREELIRGLQGRFFSESGDRSVGIWVSRGIEGGKVLALCGDEPNLRKPITP